MDVEPVVKCIGWSAFLEKSLTDCAFNAWVAGAAEVSDVVVVPGSGAVPEAGEIAGGIVAAAKGLMVAG